MIRCSWFVLLSLLLAALSACALLTTPDPTPTPTPTPPPVDLIAHRQAMQVQHALDVDQLAEQGASNYELNVTLVPESLKPGATPYLLGLVRIKYTNTEPVLLNQIYFRLFPNGPGYNGQMRVTQAMVNRQVVEPNLLANGQTLGIPLFSPLEPGQQIEIQLTYEASLPTTLNPGYGIFTAHDGVVALAGFFPMIPVFDDAGWHLDPSPAYGDATFTDIAFFDVHFTLPAGLTVATSGRTISETINDDGTRTIRAVSGPMRDFQVVLSASFEQRSSLIDGITVTSYFPAGTATRGEAALQAAALSLRSFQERFGPYPYLELDVAAVPTDLDVGGVEYPGLIIIAERYYYEHTDFLEFIVAHEVAHQWWYGLVGSNQVTEPWVDEALTNYSAVHYFEDRYGADRRQSVVESMFRAPTLQLQRNNVDLPIAGAVADFPGSLYNAVVYGKGAMFFETLRTQTGDTVYFAALRTYAERHRYSQANAEDLLQAFREAGAGNIDGLYRTWILGQN